MVQTAALLTRQLLYFVLFAVLLSAASCSTIKNYPDKPFVYQTNVQLNGKFNTDERKDLQSKLQQQLHDSVVARSKQTLGFWSTLKNPPVYDSVNADKSVIYMRARASSCSACSSGSSVGRNKAKPTVSNTARNSSLENVR